MTRTHDRRDPVRFWAGMTLVALWNAGPIALAVDLAHDASCPTDGPG